MNIRQNSPVKKIITVSVMEHRPYCGGSPPSQEKEKGSRSPLCNQEFYIKRGSINEAKSPILMKVVTDSTGSFQLRLDTGIYMLILPEKNTSFEQFYQIQSKESRMLKASSRDCFFSWWQKPDALIHLTPLSEHAACTVEATCYTGFNPCMYYFGPKPP